MYCCTMTYGILNTYKENLCRLLKTKSVVVSATVVLRLWPIPPRCLQGYSNQKLAGSQSKLIKHLSLAYHHPSIGGNDPRTVTKRNQLFQNFSLRAVTPGRRQLDRI